MIRMRDDDLVVGYGVHAWGMPHHANGVVTYTATLVPAIRQTGTRAFIVANEVDPNARDRWVAVVPDWRTEQGLFGRAWNRLNARLAPQRAYVRANAALIASTVSRLGREAGLQIFETEDSQGTAGWLSRWTGVPVVTRVHGPWFTTGMMVQGVTPRDFEIRVRHEHGAFARVAGVSAVSRDVLDRVRAHYGLELRDAAVIPNPIALARPEDRWTPATCDSGRILFVGRFDRHKGGDLIIRAFARVLQSRPRTRLTFVGPDRGCIDDDGRVWSLPEFVERHLPEPWMQGQFDWLGVRSPAEIAALRRVCFVSVLASRYECFPMAALEAMAAGCPVVAPNVGGIGEMIRHERNGLLFRPGDAEDLAARVLTLMNQPAMAESLGKQALHDAAEQYDPGLLAQRTLAFYSDVLDRAKPRRRAGHSRLERVGTAAARPEHARI